MTPMTTPKSKMKPSFHHSCNVSRLESLSFSNGGVVRTEGVARLYTENFTSQLRNGLRRDAAQNINRTKRLSMISASRGSDFGSPHSPNPIVHQRSVSLPTRHWMPTEHPVRVQRTLIRTLTRRGSRAFSPVSIRQSGYPNVMPKRETQPGLQAQNVTLKDLVHVDCAPNPRQVVRTNRIAMARKILRRRYEC